MSLSVEEYLSSGEGAVALMCEIDPYGSRNKHLISAIEIAPGTLSDRLKQAEKASLIRKEGVRGEQGAFHQYVFTDKGALLRLELEKSGAVVAWEAYKQARRKFVNRAGATTMKVSENADFFNEFTGAEHSPLTQLRNSYKDERDA